MTSVVRIFAARVLPAVACLAAIPGCNSSFSHVGVTDDQGGRGTFRFVGTADAGPAIVIPEGQVNALTLQILSQRDNPLPGAITSTDASVLQVLPLSNGAGYGFLGVAAGTATVVVTVKGRTVQTIPATVQPPPAASLPAGIDAGALLAFQSSDEAAQNPQPPMPEASGPDADATDAESIDAALVWP